MEKGRTRRVWESAGGGGAVGTSAAGRRRLLGKAAALLSILIRKPVELGGVLRFLPNPDALRIGLSVF